jgi:hypothetical protein
MPPPIAHAIDVWASLYSNSATWRTLVGFTHVAGLLVGGGTAIAADRAALRAWRRDHEGRGAHVQLLRRTHRTVLLGLGLLVASGLLMLAADLDTYLHSWVFWSKMALIVLLVLNGRQLHQAGRKALQGQGRAWKMLGYGSVISVIVWLLTTLLGAGLPNV